MSQSPSLVCALGEWPGPRSYVFCKCGLSGDGSGKVYEVLKADSIRRECEDSPLSAEGHSP